ncbi:MAG: hypothetical protein ACD_59C00053G0007 [uncultured bacterium]|nr:MAG: hypothetical protein ACD_59C00053G0007 [uncultured bacterium]
MQEYLLCPKCVEVKFETKTGFKNCNVCGTILIDKCPNVNCKKPFDIERCSDLFCVHCGTALRPKPVYRQ